jgi:UDP-N-acetylglucosamine/UDP-N-acetylgalactosamine diphosphorylase
MAAGSSESDMALEGTKGTYPITPVTGKSLFQLHTEKVLALRNRYEVKIPLFVMTSSDNHQETVNFFEKNDNFGLPGEDLIFLSQSMLPLVDTSGNIILEDKGRLCMNPDGHGGAIRALYTSGALDEMEERGIQYIFYFQVDNPLVKMLDPVFLGYHHIGDADISSKVVKKKYPEEKVGVLGKINGWLGVVEHSDLTKEEMYARDENGELKYFAGNIAIHIFDVSFVRKLGEGEFRLAFHTSERMINYINKKGELKEPTGKNAVKFESFIFDALQFANTTISLEVPREEEFSPFKTLIGEDSLEICRSMISSYYKRWLVNSGFHVSEDESSRVEISPLFAIDAEEFCRKVKKERALLSEKLFIE